MIQRITSCLLVILKHEKPVKDLPDVIAARLSMMEGVDGSGVEVISLSATERKLIDALSNEKKHAGKSGFERLAEDMKNVQYESVWLSDEERNALVSGIAAARVAPLPALIFPDTNPSGMSDTEIDKAARVLTKGMGENIKL